MTRPASAPSSGGATLLGAPPRVTAADADPVEVAREVLRWLDRAFGPLDGGRGPTGPLDDRAVLRRATVEQRVEAGVANGTLALATGLALAGAALVAERAGTTLVVEEAAVIAQVYLPLVLGVGATATPTAPRPTVDGAVCADLGADGDRDAFDRLLDCLGPGPHGAEALAERAQEWRLPVTPYRRLASAPAGRPGGSSARWPSPRRFVGDEVPDAAIRAGRWGIAASPPTDGPRVAGVAQRATGFVTGATPTASRPGPGHGLPPQRAGELPLQGVSVVDLTIMWAGPLATWLLASLGADVIKVEPSCRPDGLRGSPAWFAALDRGKRRADLDLRRAADRERFFELVAGAHLVVDNFSPRVAPNLGIGPAALRALNPGVSTLSMPAFPAGRVERDWVAYGTGAHAISGLGDTGPGPDGFRAPAVTYPDPIAGFTAFAVAAALIARRSRTDGGAPTPPAADAEVSLCAALEPLRRCHDGGRTLRRPLPDGALASLADAVLDAGGLPAPPATDPAGAAVAR